MAIKRRDFLGLAVVGASLLPLWDARVGSVPSVFASGYGTPDERFGLAVLTPSGVQGKPTPAPGRLHAFTPRPGASECIAVARRPGTFGLVFDPASGAILRQFSAEDGRHFYGHGVFCADGRYLFTTENDFSQDQGQSRGVIGVRDAARGYEQVAEWASGGIGPHELLLTADGTILIVANGGILTHPETGRAKLNLDDMRPSLAALDARMGNVIRVTELSPEQRPLSIRHLAATPQGHVVFGMQDEDKGAGARPLVGLWRADGTVVLLTAPEAELAALEGYIGSVAVDSRGQIAAASSPNGNRVAFWALDTLAYRGAVELPDACGIAPTGQVGWFLITGGAGDIAMVDALGQPRIAARVTADLQWDNHLAMLG